MNAVLQMMVHNPLLASYFLGMGHPTHTCPISKEPEKKNESDSEEEDDEPKKEQQTCVACGMTELFSDVTMVDQPLPAHAVNLLFASWKNIPVSLPFYSSLKHLSHHSIQEMSGKGQQDAQEWFTYIIDRLHEAVATNNNPGASEKTNSITNGSAMSSKDAQCVCFFHKVFYGRYNSQITCDTCHTVSSREDEFSSIPLDFKKQARKKKKAAAAENLKIAIPTLYECLKTYTTPEPLSPEQYNCNECNTRRSASKHTRIRKLPAILCVHVKRFGGKQLSTGVFLQEKYEGKLEFPLHLDMGPYTTRAPPATNGANGHGGKADKEKDYLYDLDCVVVHQGEKAQNGHYFAFCRQDNKWFRYDDEIVSATTTEDVLRQEAYLLFYSLRSLERV
jgi:ubiquitin carboxyl-terminal hydrolase 22/27/51